MKSYPTIFHISSTQGRENIAEKFLTHPHDLIHKATGWMLREVGNRGGKTQLINFLNKYKVMMPRTMLRYAIERFSDTERNLFMQKINLK
ncbi:MAG: DNA alkylation repair protein [Muribaculaceae bacterium]|nr:DNA alkylation repair protein [Muribaculaceae bacterium]